MRNIFRTLLFFVVFSTAAKVSWSYPVNGQTAPFQLFAAARVNMTHSSVDGGVAAGGSVHFRNTGVAALAKNRGVGILSGGRIHFEHGDLWHGGMSAYNSIHISKAAVHGDVVSGDFISLRNGDLHGMAIANSYVSVHRASLFGKREGQRYRHPFRQGLWRRHLEASAKNWARIPSNTALYMREARHAEVWLGFGENVLNLSAFDLEELDALIVYAQVDSFLVLNVRGESVDLSHLELRVIDRQTRRGGRVLMNFAEARSLRLGETLVEASLLAPMAETWFYGAEVHGFVYAESLKGSAVFVEPRAYYGPIVWPRY